MMGLQARKEFPMPDSRLRSGAPMSPLLLSHHLLVLAEDADRAGLRRSAQHLVELALDVCTDRPQAARTWNAPVLPEALLPANVTRLATAAVA